MTLKEKIIKEIENNFDDMKDALVENGGSELTPLFRDYTEEIIKIVEMECENFFLLQAEFIAESQIVKECQIKPEILKKFFESEVEHVEHFENIENQFFYIAGCDI